MPIEFRCTDCGKLLRTPDDTAGKQAKCPECGTVMQIPTAEEPLSPPAAASDVGSQPQAAADSSSPFAPNVPPPPDATDPDNPYQSPTDYQTLAGPPIRQGFPELQAYALARVSGPATGLIVTGALGLALQLVGLVAQVVMLGIEGAGGAAQDPAMLMFSGTTNIVLGLLGIVMAILVIAGAMKMKKLESHGLAMTSAIVALIPCISPCCLLGLPLGIWALVVLSDGQVQAAFNAAKSRPIAGG